jgi:hypothetical protein
MVQGYREAVTRFSTAIRDEDGGDRFGYAWRKRVEGAEVLAGIRYVRNRVHHDWADALQEEHGARFPLRFRVVSHSCATSRSGSSPT